MTQTKIQGKFYPLTSEITTILRQAKLTAAEWRLWSYLIELDPWGDRYEDLPSTLTIMQEVGIKKSTFYAAIAKFQKLELFDFQDKGFAFRNLRGIPKIRKVVQEIGNDSENSENQSSEPLPAKDSNSPQTIKTYSDFKDSLSKSERENFLNFVREEIKDFKPQIKDLEAWLASKNQAGQNRWEIYYNNFLASLKTKPNSQQPLVPKNHLERVRKHREEIEQRRKAAEEAWLRKQEASHEQRGELK